MKLRYKKTLLWTLVFLQVLIIFSFSFQSADQSSFLSMGITERIKSRQQIEKQVAQEKNEEGQRRYKSDYAVKKVAERKSVALEKVIRKMAHAFLFFVLSMLMIFLMRTYKIGRITAGILSILYSGAVGFLDETIQLFSEGRAGMFTDVLIDIGGAAFAATLFVVGGLLYEKNKAGCNKVDS